MEDRCRGPGRPQAGSLPPRRLPPSRPAEPPARVPTERPSFLLRRAPGLPGVSVSRTRSHPDGPPESGLPRVASAAGAGPAGLCGRGLPPGTRRALGRAHLGQKLQACATESSRSLGRDLVDPRRTNTYLRVYLLAVVGLFERSADSVGAGLVFPWLQRLKSFGKEIEGHCMCCPPELGIRWYRVMALK